MRTKENANDYRFIKEPDIPAVDISELKESVQVEYGFLPYEIEKTLIAHGLTAGEAKYFSSNMKKAHILFSINDKVHDILGIAKILMNYITDKDFDSLDVESISKILLYHQQSAFSKDLLKYIIRQSLADVDFDYQSYVAEHQSLEEDFMKIIEEILAEKVDIVKKIKAGDTKKINLLVGEIVKRS